VSDELLIDLDEAARRLSMCRRSVQTLVYASELRAVRIGRSRRISVADLEAYVNGLREANDRGDFG
jgi:excisionase family DNA binding protein